jgi:hypothetical protein
MPVRCQLARGRPPFLPFNLAAAALRLDVALPPRRPSWLIHARVPKTPAARAATPRSKSSVSHRRLVPAGDISTLPSSAEDALESPSMSCLGKETEQPLFRQTMISLCLGSYRAHVASGWLFSNCAPRLRAARISFANRAEDVAAGLRFAMNLTPLLE